MLDESGYTEMWQKDRSADAAGRLENLKELVRSMEEFENLQGFLEHISLVMDRDGGPDEDIFVEFGVSPTVFFHRLRAILNSPRWSQLTPSLAQQLREICDNRLRGPEIRAS